MAIMQETIPSKESFVKPKLDRSLERKARKFEGSNTGTDRFSNNSPGRLPVFVTLHLKEPVRVVDSRTPQPFTLKKPIREQSSSSILQTQFVPMFS